MHRPGIEPGSVPWQGTILPLDHRCDVTRLCSFQLYDVSVGHFLDYQWHVIFGEDCECVMRGSTNDIQDDEKL
jgi:hypothetical protein